MLVGLFVIKMINYDPAFILTSPQSIPKPHFDLTTKSLTSWNPNVGTTGSNIEDIEVNGDTVYVVGRFTTISSQPRTNAAAISVTGQLLP